MDPGVMDLAGARPEKPNKYTSVATVKWIGGLQTQRSVMMSIDTRYNSRFLGGKPDALISGSNCEISNDLTIQRRPGLLPFGTASIPSPTAFYSWQQTTPPLITVLVDTSTGGTFNAGEVFTYGPTSAGGVFNKTPGSGQTNFFGIADTVYMGDGIDLLKWTGPDTGITAPTIAPTLSFIPGGTLPATVYTVKTTIRTLNAESQGSPQATLSVPANNLLVVASPTAPTSPFALGWSVYIGTTSPTNQIISMQNTAIIPFGTNYTIPAQGITFTNAVPPPFNRLEQPTPWGIPGPTTAPTVTNTPLASPYPPWAANTYYSPSLTVIDPNGNIELLTTGGETGASQPAWNTILGGTTTDNTAIWTNQGPAAWIKNHVYAAGALVYVTFTVTTTTNPSPPPPPPTTPKGPQAPQDGSGGPSRLIVVTTTYNNVFQTTLGGTSGATQPIWVAGVGSTVTDGSIVWTNLGVQATWATTIGANQLVSTATTVLDSNQNLENINAPGKSGASAPAWKTVAGTITVDNTATWTNAGPLSLSSGGTGVYTYVYSYVNFANGHFI